MIQNKLASIYHKLPDVGVYFPNPSQFTPTINLINNQPSNVGVELPNLSIIEAKYYNFKKVMKMIIK